MPEKLSPEAEERILALCRKISVAHNLDEEIQAELYAHMEDKLLGYLSGDEKVTEEDAFILVREHFGDPAVIKEMLQKTHGAEANTSLMRRLGAVATASLAAGCFVQLLLVFCEMYLLVNQQMRKPISEITRVVGIVFMMLPAFFLWVELLVWEKGMDHGRRMWFYHVDRNTFLLYFLIFVFFSMMLYSLALKWSSQLRTGHEIHQYFIPLLLQCPIWLWWCDSSPQHYRALLAGALAWAAYCVITGVIWSFNFGDYLILNPFITITLYCYFFFASLVIMGFYIALSNVRTIREWFESGIAR
ncbi:MAG: hypothetical protein ACYC9O_12315 [Candidatus Latescibacterota bacterium]